MLAKALCRRFASDESLLLTSSHNFIVQAKLNKPKALNALDLSLVKLLQTAVDEWNTDPNVKVAVFRGAGGKAFCAGGDIRALYNAKTGLESPDLLREFYWKEYCLDYAIATMKPIQVALYEGIVMGGGVGISIHAPIRVATETSIFAMPETAIGFFPDVGGSYFLPRLSGALGLYLATTGARLTSEQLVQAGVATHYVSTDRLNELRDALIKDVTLDTTPADVSSIVDRFSVPVSGPLPNLTDIEAIFGGVTSIEHIYHNLAEAKTDWAKGKLAAMQKLSPLAQSIVFEQIKRGRDLTLAEAFKMEFRLSQKFMEAPEFFEGIRANLIDKDKTPVWMHKTVFEVSDALVESFFEPLSEDLVL
jgi:enoyl-CoA hydratase/carnithine racemase